MPTMEEAREMLRKVSNPKLDAFRARVPSMLTSEIVGYVTNGEALADQLLPEDPFEMKKDEEMTILAAAALAVCDELDIRIPPRVKS